MLVIMDMKERLGKIALIGFAIIQFMLYCTPTVLMMYGAFILFKSCESIDDKQTIERIEKLEKELNDIISSGSSMDYAECKNKCKELLSLCNDHSEMEDIDLVAAPAHFLLGKIYYDEADYDIAKIHLLKSANACDVYKHELIAYGAQWYYEMMIMQYLMLGDIAKQQNNWQECDKYMEHIWLVLQKNANTYESQQLLPMFIVKYGHMASHFLNYTKAEELYKEIIDNEKIYSKYVDYDKYCIEAYYGLISIYVAQLQSEKAIALYNTMLDNDGIQHTDDISMRCSCIMSIAVSYLYQNDIDQALNVIRNFKSDQTTKYGYNSVQYVLANAVVANIDMFANAIMGEENCEEKISTYESDVKFWDKKNQYRYPSEYRLFVVLYSNMLMNCGRYTELELHCNQLIDIYHSSTLIREEYVEAGLLYAECLLEQSKFKEAETVVKDIYGLVKDNHLYISRQLEATTLLASIYNRQGCVDKGQEAMDKAYRLILDFPLAEIDKSDPLGYAEIIKNLYDNYIVYGDYQRALDISSILIETYKKVNIGLNNNLSKAYLYQASAYRGLNDIDNMIAAGSSAIELGGNDSINCLANDIVGYGYIALGEYDKAEHYLNIALSYINSIEPEIKNVCYKDLSLLYVLKGDYKQATIFASKITDDNYDDTLLIAWQSGNKNQSENLVVEYYNGIVNDIKDITSKISNEQFTTFAHNRLDWDILPSIALSFDDSIKCLQVAYDSAINFKGVSLRTGVEIAKYIRNSGIPVLNDKLNQILSMQDMLSNTTDTTESTRLRYKIDNEEAELYKLLYSIDDSALFYIYNWKDVAERLGDNDLAIEFVECNRSITETCYVAMILRKGWDSPKIVELCDKKELASVARIDPSSKIYRNDKAGKHKLEETYYKKGYKLIWDKLSRYVNGTNNVYFSPDGLLHQINIEAFQDNAGRMVSDMCIMHRLSSTRELCIDQVKNDKKSMVLYGGLNYDMNVQDMVAHSRHYTIKDNVSVSRSIDKRNCNSSRWIKLSGTKSEVDKIAKICHQYKIETRTFIANDGNEESFKALSGKNTPIIHLATHGLFVKNNETYKMPFYNTVRNDNPLRRSALIFAGANNAWSGETIPHNIDDGVLLAEEIAAMDLTGTDLVVLSACETGLGDITSEGVFGLQRAFKKAGVKTLIMSLWKVDDAATSYFMQTFYDEWLGGKTKLEAFAVAQKRVREYSDEYSNPYYWAGFIMLD